MYDYVVLKPVFNAIKEIASCINKLLQENDFKKFNIINGFIGWPEPNPYYYRTSYNLYLLVDHFENGERVLHSIMSPFGEVKLLGFTGCTANIQSFTSKFLETMDWQLEDVTHKLQTTWINLLKNRIGEKQSAAYPEKSFYLIKKVKDIEFIEPTEYLYYNHVTLEDYSKDREFFKTISEGKNSFM